MPLNGLFATGAPLIVPSTTSGRELSSVFISFGTGNACCMVQPPVGPQLVPRLPPARYSGSVSPTLMPGAGVCAIDGRYTAAGSAAYGIDTTNAPLVGAGSRRVSVLEFAK